ncbi:hypothetical protein H7F15_04295 [Pontibacter sp. Tf4]|uniref:hypothetical protein n=1 Tax=Pontibacter sp. Tf4 TaxID=2761620 RepID=UPI001628E531|nr:hypothetical protein [Pontibacter sp. Tf4]MBB6610249.1 hypothetical protein [Pontibacter sp. Tf4]
MEPEEIDKLFNERLGRMAPTPPADLWNRLQDRIETEMPQPKHEQKHRFGFFYYSIAAAITLLLAVGVVLKFNQPQTIANQTIAQTEVTKQPTDGTIAQETTTIPEQTIAAVTPEVETTTEPERPAIVAEQATPAPVKQSAPAKARTKSEERWVKVEPAANTSALLAQQTTKPVTPEAEPEQTVAMHTPVSFAAANSAEPVEITIKRTVVADETALASASDRDDQESTSFERKQKLAKNIFKQVKNLSNGERINLEEVGINADRIALETKIGKQKISKVINL